MKLPPGVRRAGRRLLRPFQRRAVILLYHRVAELERDPWSLAVSPARFEEQLEVLTRRYRTTPLADLAMALEKGDLPSRSVALTFDDGYADNFETALPCLRCRGIPATFYLVAEAIGAPRELWWDELEAILLSPGRLPPILDLRVDGDSWTFDLAGAEVYDPDRAARASGWRAGQPPPSPRQAVYLALWRRLKALAPVAREHAMAALRDWAGREPWRRDSHRIAGWEAVRGALAAGSIEVGSHTLRHPALSALPVDLQREEITKARQRIEARLGTAPVRSFSYPFGDHGPETAELVRQAGYHHACAGGTEAVRPGANLHLLPRVHVHDVGGAEFERRLARWL